MLGSSELPILGRGSREGEVKTGGSGEETKRHSRPVVPEMVVEVVVIES